MSPVNSHCLYNSCAPFLFVYPQHVQDGGALPTVKEAYKGSHPQELGCPLSPTLREPGMDFDTLVLLGDH